MLKIALASITAVALLIALPANAQMRAPESHFYGGFGIGQTDNDIAGALDSRDSGWKAFGGFQFNRNFAVEGGYVDLGQAVIPGRTLESTAWHASALGILPVNQQFALFGKLGLARTDTDISGFGSSDSTEPAYGLGLSYLFTRQVGIRGEWERFRLGDNPFTGKSDVDLFSISAAFHFN